MIVIHVAKFEFLNNFHIYTVESRLSVLRLTASRRITCALQLIALCLSRFIRNFPLIFVLKFAVYTCINYAHAILYCYFCVNNTDIFKIRIIQSEQNHGFKLFIERSNFGGLVTPGKYSLTY